MEKTINISQISIKLAVFEDRFENRFVNHHNRDIGKIPIKVVLSQDSNNYVVVEGREIFLRGIEEGVESFTCIVIGEVSSDTEASIERMRYVLKDHRPFHILEQTMAIYQLYQHLQSTHKGSIYSNGGDRRSGNYKKNKVDDLLLMRIPYQEYLIGDLRRFGENIGMIGIEGLYIVLEEKGEKLNISTIHNNNSRLNRDYIEELISKLRDEGRDEDEIKKQIGLHVHRILFAEDNPTDAGEIDPTDENPAPGNDHDTKDDESEDKTTKSEEESPPINPPFGPVDEEGVSEIKKAFSKHFEAEEALKTFFQKHDCWDKSQAEESHKLFKRLQASFTELISTAYREMAK